MAVDLDLYRSLHKKIGAFLRLYNRFEVSGVEHIPASGGALLCPRHQNMSDPFFVGAGMPRELHFLAFDGVEQIPLLGPVFSRLGVVHTVKTSMGRSGDDAGVKSTMTVLQGLLESGNMCVIFPEGNINNWFDAGGLKAFRPGAVRLAAQAGVPIVPAGIVGSRWVVPCLFNLQQLGGPDVGIWLPIALPMPVRLRFGPLFHVDPAAADDKDVAASETERLRQAVAAILDEMNDPDSVKHRLAKSQNLLK